MGQITNKNRLEN